MNEIENQIDLEHKSKKRNKINWIKKIKVNKNQNKQRHKAPKSGWLILFILFICVHPVI